MNLTNIFGLTGVMFLLLILNSMEMSFGMACCLLLLSEKEKEQKTALVRKVRLVRKNPLHELSEAQFKKNFVFERLIFLVWLLCYHGPLYCAHNMGWYSLQRFICLWFLPKQRNSAISILKDIQKFGNLQIVEFFAEF